MEKGNRSTQIVRSHEPIIDIVNKDQNSTLDEPDQTNMSTVKEVRVDIERNQNKITVEEPMSAPAQLREVLVPEGDTTIT